MLRAGGEEGSNKEMWKVEKVLKQRKDKQYDKNELKKKIKMSIDLNFMGSFVQR